MSSSHPTDEALEKEDRIDEMEKQIKISPPVPPLLQAQQALALPCAKVVGRPGTGSYPAPLPDPTTYTFVFNLTYSRLVDLHILVNYKSLLDLVC